MIVVPRKLKFRKKIQVGLILKVHEKIKVSFKLLKIEKILKDLIFTEEVLKSIYFLSNYSCSPLSLIFKQFMNGYSENVKSQTSLENTSQNILENTSQNIYSR